MPLTGNNLLQSIIDSSGVNLNNLLKITLSAKLQQMIDNGTYSNLAAAIAISGFSTEIKNSIDIIDLSDRVKVNKELIGASESLVDDDLISPVVTTATASYAENSAEGTVVFTVSADPIETDAVYSIESGNDNAFYEMDAATGEISLTQIGSVSAANDFEAVTGETIATNSFTLGVKATDIAGNMSNVADVVLSVMKDPTEVDSSTSGTLLTIRMSNSLNLATGAIEGPIEGFTAVSFKVGEIDVVTDVTGLLTYTQIVDAINSELTGLGFTTVSASTDPLEDVFFSIDTTVGIDDTVTFPAGSVAGQYNPISVINTGPEDLIQGYFIIDAEFDGELNSIQNNSPIDTSTITINLSATDASTQIATDGIAENFIYEIDSSNYFIKPLETGNITLQGFNAAEDKLFFNDVSNGTTITETFSSDALIISTTDTQIIFDRELFNDADFAITEEGYSLILAGITDLTAIDYSVI